MKTRPYEVLTRIHQDGTTSSSVRSITEYDDGFSKESDPMDINESGPEFEQWKTTYNASMLKDKSQVKATFDEEKRAAKETAEGLHTEIAKLRLAIEEKDQLLLEKLEKITALEASATKLEVEKHELNKKIADSQKSYESLGVLIEEMNQTKSSNEATIADLTRCVETMEGHPDVVAAKQAKAKAEAEQAINDANVAKSIAEARLKAIEAVR